MPATQKLVNSGEVGYGERIDADSLLTALNLWSGLATDTRAGLAQIRPGVPTVQVRCYSAIVRALPGCGAPGSCWHVVAAVGGGLVRATCSFDAGMRVNAPEPTAATNTAMVCTSSADISTEVSRSRPLLGRAIQQSLLLPACLVDSMAGVARRAHMVNLLYVVVVGGSSLVVFVRPGATSLEGCGDV